MLNSIVLDWSPTSPTAFKTWMKRIHANHLVSLPLAVMVSLLSRLCYANFEVIHLSMYCSWNHHQCILHWWCCATQQWQLHRRRQGGGVHQQCLGHSLWWWMGWCRCVSGLQAAGLLPNWYVSLCIYIGKLDILVECSVFVFFCHTPV